MTGAPSLYDLLPALYRNRDARVAGQPLRALCTLLDGAAATVEGDITALYRGWFVETCDPWALSYLAQLVGLCSLPGGAADPRLLVADAVAIARRKGTYPALEHQLSAVGGWPVQICYGPGDREAAVARYWPDPVYPLRRVTPFAHGDGRYHFHPLGLDCPLFSAPRRRRGIETPFDEASDAPRPLGPDPSPVDAGAFEIMIEDATHALVPLAQSDIAFADLSSWARAPAGQACVTADPVLGRFMIADRQDLPAPIAVSFAYAAAGDIGGGPYERAPSPADSWPWLAYVHRDAAARPRRADGVEAFATIAEAIAAFGASRGAGLIRILDGSVYEIGRLVIDADALPCPNDPNAPRRLAIEALSGEAPVLRGSLRVSGGGAGVELRLNGLWVDGWIELEGPVAAHLEHCTIHSVSALAAGSSGETAPASIVFVNESAVPSSLSLDACLTGPLDIAQGVELVAHDSVIDGYSGFAVAGGSDASLTRTTLLGSSEFSSLDAIDTIFGGALAVERPGLGELRYCAIACPDDLPGADLCVRSGEWSFRSASFGAPGYARLKLPESADLVTAASNGSEIGVFNSQMAALRESLILTTLEEGLPVGILHRIEQR